jgi:hypothetical protein
MSNNQELNFVVDGLDYSVNLSSRVSNNNNNNQNSNYIDDNSSSDEIDSEESGINDEYETVPNTIHNDDGNVNGNDTDLERAIQESLQTQNVQNIQNTYAQEEFDRELQEVLQKSKDDEQERLNSIKSNTFSAPILPMSMLPENLFQYYTNINQTSNKILVPQEILLHLFPENGYQNQEQTNLGQSGNPILFQLTGYLIPRFEDVVLEKPYIYSIDSFLDIESIYLTDYAFQKLGLDVYTSCNFNLLDKNLEKANKMVLKPLQKEFLQIKDQESLLLPVLNKDFKIIHKGQIITIHSIDLNIDLDFEVLELEPDLEVASITDVDLIVDFNIPEEFIPKPPKREFSHQSNKSHNPQDLVSINSSIFNFDTDSITNFSKDTNFPGASQTLSSNNGEHNGEHNGENVGGGAKELSRQELREARLRAFQNKK